MRVGPDLLAANAAARVCGRWKGITKGTISFIANVRMMAEDSGQGNSASDAGTSRNLSCAT